MKVSIITVCLNSEKHIEQTILSVLNQTYKEIEYIIVDGLSTDKTLDIIEKYKPLFKDRLKVISERDDGLYYAMNKGIRYATGEVIGIINSDDWYEESAVEKVVRVYNENKNSVIYGVVPCWKQNSIVSIEVVSYKENHNQMIPHPSMFVSKKVYDELGVFDTQYKILADQDLVFRFLNNNIKFNFIPEVLANFRLGGLSNTLRELYFNERRIILEKYHCYKELTINPKTNYKIECLWDSLYNRIRNENKSNIFLYGTGSHTKTLLENIPVDIKINIRGIVDLDPKINDLYGYKVFKLNEIVEIAQMIIISSISYEYDIYERIKHLEDEIKIMRIYGANSIKEVNERVKDAIVL